MSSEYVHDGKTWVCTACGKTSKDRYGDIETTRGWDASCFVNSHLVDDTLIIRGEDSRVKEIIHKPLLDEIDRLDKLGAVDYDKYLDKLIEKEQADAAHSSKNKQLPPKGSKKGKLNGYPCCKDCFDIHEETHNGNPAEIY